MTLETLEKKLKPYEAPAHGPLLRWLYDHFPPRVIENRAMHARYKKAVEVIMEALILKEVPQGYKQEAEEFLNVVAGLIQAYERREFPMKEASPRDVLQFLMEEHGLSQTDIAPDLGGQPNVSNVLSGKRDLNKEQIERLSKRFHVSPAVFFPALQ